MIENFESVYIGGGILFHESIFVKENIKEFSRMIGKLPLLERLGLKSLCSKTDEIVDSIAENRSLRTLTMDRTEYTAIHN